MRTKQVILALAAVSLVAACASGTNTVGKAADRECFDIQMISSWSVLDDKHLYVKGAGAANHFILTMFARCPGIRSAEALAFSNYTNRLCSNDFGSVSYRDGGYSQTCRINNIERVNSRDEAKELAGARKKAKDEDS